MTNSVFNPHAQMPSERYSLPPVGLYKCQHERSILFRTEPLSRGKGQLAYLVEFKIVESTNPMAPPGTMGKWYRGDPEGIYGQKEVKAFQLAVLGIREDGIGPYLQDWARIGDASGDARNLFHGLFFCLEVKLGAPSKKDGKQYANAHFGLAVPNQGEEVLRRLAQNPHPVALPPKPPAQQGGPQYPNGQSAFGGYTQPVQPPGYVLPPAPGYAPPGHAMPHAPAYPTPAYPGQQTPAPQQYGAPPPTAYDPRSAPPAPVQAPPPPPPNPFTGQPMALPPGVVWDGQKYVQR